MISLSVWYRNYYEDVNMIRPLTQAAQGVHHLPVGMRLYHILVAIKGQHCVSGYIYQKAEILDVHGNWDGTARVLEFYGRTLEM